MKNTMLDGFDDIRASEELKRSVVNPQKKHSFIPWYKRHGIVSVAAVACVAVLILVWANVSSSVAHIPLNKNDIQPTKKVNQSETLYSRIKIDNISQIVGSLLYSHYYYNSTGYFLGIVEITDVNGDIYLKDYDLLQEKIFVSEEINKQKLFKSKIIKLGKSDKDYGKEIYLSVARYNESKCNFKRGDTLLVCGTVIYAVNNTITITNPRQSLSIVTKGEIDSNFNRLLKDYETADEALTDIKQMFDKIDPRAKAAGEKYRGEQHD